MMVPSGTKPSARAGASRYDICIVGAGIVGASIAFHLGAKRSVLLLEGERHAGCHSTGRSAALYVPTYGPEMVRALTRASRAFFVAPPTGFCAHPLLAPRGALAVGDRRQEALGRDMLRFFAQCGATPLWLEGTALRARVPVLRQDACAFGVYDPAPADIDVAALLHGFLAGARRQGAQLVTDARVSAIFRERGDWRLACADGRSFVAQTIVNATGAWADDIAAQAGVRAIGIEPRRRSAFVFDPPAGMDTRNWPAVVRVDESSYFKPDAGLLVGSPANADPVAPHDVVPEEIDIARGIDAIERYTTLTIRRPRRTWAGLRCFVADGEPVLGFDPVEPSFFWAAALGGYGIQSAPAVGRLCAALLRDEELPADLAALGVRLGRLRPDRARDAA